MHRKPGIHMNLQLLAQDSGLDGGTSDVTPEASGNEADTQDPKEEQSFEDILNNNKDYKDAFDKKVQEELKKERHKWEDDKAKEVEDAVNEAERLSKMSKEDREKELYKKEKAKFEKEKAQFEKQRLLMETNKQMLQRNLPTDFAKYLLGDSAESTLNNINEFENLWTTAVSAAVDAKISGSSPRIPEGDNKKGLSIEDIKHMSTEQIMKNFKSVSNALKNK